MKITVFCLNFPRKFLELSLQNLIPLLYTRYHPIKGLGTVMSDPQFFLENEAHLRNDFCRVVEFYAVDLQKISKKMGE